MRKFWLPVLVFAIPNGHAAPAPAGCTLHQLASVDLEITDRGMMVIPVEINGTPGKMALDLVNINARVTQTAVTQLKLAVNDSPSVFRIVDGKRQPLQVASVSSLKVGGAFIARGHVQVLSFPTDPPDMGLGTITTDLLRNVDFEIDPKHRTVKL